MDQKILNIRKLFAFIDDILIVTKGTKDRHLAKYPRNFKGIRRSGHSTEMIKMQNRTIKNRMAGIQAIRKWS